MFDTLQKIFGLGLGAVILYVLVINYKGSSQVINSLAGGTAGLFGTLQGRNVNYPGGVSVGGLATGGGLQTPSLNI